MVFAILLGVLVLLIAAVVIAVRTVALTRREVLGLEEELAEARGVDMHPQTAGAPWSSVDLASLCDDGEPIPGDDPYETLTVEKVPAEPEGVRWHAARGPSEPEPFGGVDLFDDDDEDANETVIAEVAPAAEARGPTWHAAPRSGDPELFDVQPLDDHDANETVIDTNAPAEADAPMWHTAPRASGAEQTPTGALEPVTWRGQHDQPVVVLVVGAGFLGAVNSGVTAATQLRPESMDANGASATAQRNKYDAGIRTETRSTVDARSLRDEIVDVYKHRVSEHTADAKAKSRRVPNGNGSDPAPISWRPQGEVSTTTRHH
jgi:hypothetical protein